MRRRLTSRLTLAVAAFVALIAASAVAASAIGSSASEGLQHSYDYDGLLTPADADSPALADGYDENAFRVDASPRATRNHRYDDRALSAGAAARPGGYRLAPNTAGSVRRVNPLGGTQNCVNCAIATDATLAGRPASALTSSGPQPISILERTFGGSFKPVSGADEIQQLLMDAGPGSRGIVFGSRGADPGHVFNAVNQRGVVRFLDGQSGGPASFDGFDALHFLRTDL